MDNEPFKNERTPTSTVLKDIASSAGRLIRSETHLARTELKEASENLRSHITQTVVFAVVAILGILPFLAFLTIGLGDLMDGRYWLSSLIVALLCFGVGGGLAYRAAKKIGQSDLTLGRTRATVEDEMESIGHRVEETTHRAKRSVA